MPSGNADGRGTWTLTGNIFKAQVNFSDGLHTDSGAFSNNLKSITGIETDSINTEFSTYSLTKQ